MAGLPMTATTASSDATLREFTDYVREQVTPIADEYERARRFPRELLNALADLGLLRRAFDHDGSSEAYYRTLEILAEGWVAVAESMNLQVLAARPLAGFGSAELRAELLPELIAMRLIVGNCITEADAGSDLSGLATVAVPDGGDFILTGTKVWVGHAPVADLFNVFCRTGGSGLGGISCLLVDRNAPGVSVGPERSKMGVKSLPTADVVFDGVRVPRLRLIGRLNRGMVAAADLFNHGRLGMAACAIGLSEAALRYATRYAEARHQFGQPVIRFQGIASCWPIWPPRSPPAAR